MRCKDSEFGVSFHEFVGYSLNMLGNVDKFVFCCRFGGGLWGPLLSKLGDWSLARRRDVKEQICSTQKTRSAPPPPSPEPVP